MDFRTCIHKQQQQGFLKLIKQEVDPNLQVSHKISAVEPNPVLFENIKGMQLAANLFCKRKNYSRYLNLPMNDFLHNLSHKLTHAKISLKVDNAIYGDIEWEEIDLTKLPILTHYQGDGGRYITSGVWIVNDPLLGCNLSFHRMMVLNANQGSVRVVENRGMHRTLINSGGEAEVAICIGVSPAILLAAACSPPENADEMELAARLDQISLVKCKTVSLYVPEDCEIVLEGHFINKLANEGPFLDITGTWDKIRQQPVVEITRIAHRRNPIYHALVPAKAEHRILMGMPKELDIYNEVNKVCRCLDVRVTDGGCAWLHAVVKIDKQQAQDGKLALEAAFNAHKSLKHCIVVDDDIDIRNLAYVEWAIATRFQADKDLIILKDQPSSSLDPSATHIKGKKSRGSKMGLDATIKEMGEAKKLFQRTTKP